MFKKMLLVLAVAAFSFSLASLAAAQDAEKGPLSLSLRGNLLTELCGEEDFGFGVAAEYDLPWYDLSLEAAVDRLVYYDEPTAELNSTNMSLSLKYNFKQLEEKRVVPYLLGGIGVMLNDDSNIADSTDNSFETHIGAGLNYMLNEDWTLYGEGKYLWSRAGWNESYETGEKMKRELDGFVVMTGMKYRF